MPSPSRFERVLPYAAVALSLAALAGWRGADSAAHAEFQDSATPHKVGTVDALALLREMLNSDAYGPARETMQKEAEARLQQGDEELRRLNTELELLPQGDPRGQQLRQQLQQGFQLLQQQGQQEAAAFQQFSAGQATDAYRQILEAVRGVADEKGYTHVLTTRAGDTPDRSDNPAGVIQEILSRPVVVSPLSDDLTPAVRERLALPVPSEPGAAEGEAAPAAPAEGAEGAAPAATEPGAASPTTGG